MLGIDKSTLAEIRARLAPVRAWLALRIAQGEQWLNAERAPLTWAGGLWTTLTTLKLPSTYARRFTVLAGIIVLLWFVGVSLRAVLAPDPA